MSVLNEHEDKQVRRLIRTILEEYERIRSQEEPDPVIAESTSLLEEDGKNEKP